MTIEQMIEDWAKAFDLPVEENPVTKLTPFNFEMIFLGKDLIEEEVKEFTDEFNEDSFDVNRFADHLGDTIWVVIRMCQTLGLSPSELITEIYKSNMSKLCETESEAKLTVDSYANGAHPAKPGVKIDCEHVYSNGYWVVKNKKTGKVLKSINFVEPNFNY